MKKTFVKVVAAAALVMGLVGCDALMGGKFNADALDNDSKDWASESKQTKKADEVMKVVIADTDAIKLDTSWCVWTDEKGIVLPKQPTAAKGESGYEFTFSEEIINLVDYNESEGSERFVLYIGLKGDNTTVKNPVTGKKDGKLEDFDVRGRICVYKDRIVNVKIEKYPEVINKVGIVTIKNDEPTAKSTFVDGDYSITAIYPLNPKADENDTDEKKVNNAVGGTYIVEESMTFEKLSVAKDSSISFPVKAGKQVIGLYQENRAKNYKSATDETYNGPNTKEAILDKTYAKDIDGNGVSRADLLELDIKDDDTDEQAVKKYVAANKKIIFGYEMTVEAHKANTTAVNTSSFGSPWFVKKSSKITRVKAAGDDVEVVAVTAPVEK